MDRLIMTFGGVSSDEMGVYINRYDVLKPETRRNTQKSTHIDGEIDFDKASGGTLEARVIRVEAAIIQSAHDALMQRRRHVAAWLSRKDALRFSDEPDKYYIARSYDAVELELEAVTAPFVVTFICLDPYAYGAPIASQAGGGGLLRLPIEYPGTAPACTRLIIKNTGTVPVSGITITHHSRR